MTNGTSYKAIQTQFRAAKLLCGRAVGVDVMRNLFGAASIIVTAATASVHETVSKSFVTLPLSASVTELPTTNLFASQGEYFVKSSAQVATSVAHSVLQGCGKLKLDQKLKKETEQNSVAKSELLGVRFQIGELAIIRLKARLAGVPTNTYIRASSLGSDYNPPRNPELVKALLALNRELSVQGNNINQIARHMNGGAMFPAEADGRLGMLACSHIKTHQAIRIALSQGKEMPPEP